MVERRPGSSGPGSSGRALVLHPAIGRPGADGARLPDAALAEAVGLAAAIDLDIVDSRVVRVTQPRPATLFGTGFVEEMTGPIAQDEIDIVIVDATVSPIQQRNLERAWKTKVIDRTGLILEIFGRRARTSEGQLQVELAHLTYQRSRLVRSWTHLERQRGGAGFLGGPGESQIELDRRQIDDRIVMLKRQLEEVRRTRTLHRDARARVPYPVIALVGYTNAGKSTLFNRLTQSGVLAADMLFATLDPTMRAIDLGQGRQAILSDTVGFISDLPTHLVAAFRATLEEVSSADLILHVRDVSHPDSEIQKQDVVTVLAGLGIDAGADGRMIEVLNKIDLLDAATRETVLNGAARRPDEAAAISAATGAGIEALLDLIRKRLRSARQTVTVRLDLSDGKTLAWLHRHGEVLDRREDDRHAYVRVSMTPADVARLNRQLAESNPGRTSIP